MAIASVRPCATTINGEPLLASLAARSRCALTMPGASQLYRNAAGAHEEKEEGRWARLGLGEIPSLLQDLRVAPVDVQQHPGVERKGPAGLDCGADAGEGLMRGADEAQGRHQRCQVVKASEGCNERMNVADRRRCSPGNVETQAELQPQSARSPSVYFVCMHQRPTCSRGGPAEFNHLIREYTSMMRTSASARPPSS